MRTPRGNEAGFTLISVMIAVILLSLGLIALAKAQGVLARSETDTANRSSALAIAQGYTEVILRPWPPSRRCESMPMACRRPAEPIPGSQR
jgi:Tfp pilus assembly protein PilV